MDHEVQFYEQRGENYAELDEENEKFLSRIKSEVNCIETWNLVLSFGAFIDYMEIKKVFLAFLKHKHQKKFPVIKKAQDFGLDTRGLSIRNFSLASSQIA